MYSLNKLGSLSVLIRGIETIAVITITAIRIMSTNDFRSLLFIFIKAILQYKVIN